VLKTVAIEFFHRGKRWRTDTPEEAIKLREELEQREQDFVPPIISPWTLDTVVDLLKGIGDTQLQLLKVMAIRGRVTSSSLIQEIGIDSEESLAGFLSGLSKQLRAMGLRPFQLFQIDTLWTGKTKIRTFTLTADFKYAASLVGWPDEWNFPSDGTVKW